MGICRKYLRTILVWNLLNIWHQTSLTTCIQLHAFVLFRNCFKKMVARIFNKCFTKESMGDNISATWYKSTFYMSSHWIFRCKVFFFVWIWNISWWHHFLQDNHFLIKAPKTLLQCLLLNFYSMFILWKVALERKWWYIMNISLIRYLLCYYISVLKEKIYLYVLLLSLGCYHCWWTVIPEGIVYPVVNVSALTRFIRYTCTYWHLHFLYVIIIITKVHFP